MKLSLAFFAIAVMTCISQAGVFFTNSISADSFVRSNSPTLNYGAAGALSVSGSTATNTSMVAMGIADTFMRFNTAATVANFNSVFGANNWVINGATLVVVEVGVPNNAIFDRGKGAFQIDWISNDSWTEGTGMPMTPTMDGIVYTNETTLLTNPASLGVFTNTAVNNTNAYSLALAPDFVADMSAGGDVSLYFTALEPQTGFTFNSHNFPMASQRPIIAISATAPPGNVGMDLSGTEVVISGTNGFNGGTYVVQSSTNILLPLNQWTPVATNVLTGSGAFSITATNAAANGASQQFFILQTQ